MDDPISPIQRPRGYGDVAIFWPKFLHNHVTVHSEGDHRVTVVTLSTDNDASSMCTYHSEDTLLHFKTMRMFWHRSLRSSINLGGTMKFIILGDFNACPNGTPKTSQDRSLQQFCKEHRLVVPHNYYQDSSLEHAGGMGTSSIDHFITSNDMASNIKVCMLKMAINASDHSPIIAELRCRISAVKTKKETRKKRAPKKPIWRKADLDGYNNSINQQLCNTSLCQQAHQQDSEASILSLHKIIEQAAEQNIPSRSSGPRRNRP